MTRSIYDQLCTVQELLSAALNEQAAREQECNVLHADIARLKASVEFERKAAKAGQEDSARLAWAIANPAAFHLLAEQFDGATLTAKIDDEIQARAAYRQSTDED